MAPLTAARGCVELADTQGFVNSFVYIFIGRSPRPPKKSRVYFHLGLLYAARSIFKEPRMAVNFRDALRQSESSGNYGAVNRQGYTGAYQFGRDRLEDYIKETGESFSMEEFRQNPKLQERVQGWHERDIMKFIEANNLNEYYGKEVGGVSITPTALLGMAHLGGKSGMRLFLETAGQYNPSDAQGTSLSDYGRKFSGTPTVSRREGLEAVTMSQGPRSGDRLERAAKALAGMDSSMVDPEMAAGIAAALRARRGS